MRIIVCVSDLVQALQKKKNLPFPSWRKANSPTLSTLTPSLTQGGRGSIKLIVVSLFLTIHLLFLAFTENTPEPPLAGWASRPVEGILCGELFTLSHPIPPMTWGSWQGLMGQNGVNWLLQESNPWPISLPLCFDQLSCKAMDSHWIGIGHHVAAMP